MPVRFLRERALVNAGSTITLTRLAHGGRVILLDTAAGSTVTLPAATGSGVNFKFIVSVTPTSNQHRINVVGDDAFVGTAFVDADADCVADATVSFRAAADTDQINLNGTTTGGIVGDTVELIDYATDRWHVVIHSQATGTEATPFSTGQVS